MGGGFGFGMLADVQMLGFYQAQHARTNKPFLAYVLQVSTTTSAHFLIYRRYSQIAGLATKLHFHPSVGLPPKYALQVFPLTDEQLRQRFEGLQAFMNHVFLHLQRQFDAGAHHDVDSSAGLDMQIFYDFVAHQRNRPPTAVRAVPEWALPTALHGVYTHDNGNAANGPSNGFGFARSRASSTSSSVADIDSMRSHAARRSLWHDVDSVTDSEDVGAAAIGDIGDMDNASHSDASGTDAAKRDASNAFRNELLQAEGNLNALWNCVRAYARATSAWWDAAGAVADEYKRVADMPLFSTPTAPVPAPVPASVPISTAPEVPETPEPLLLDEVPVSTNTGPMTPDTPETATESERDANRRHALQLADAHRRLLATLQPTFERACATRVLAPLESLVRDVLPDVKQSYWTRHAVAPTAVATDVNVRRLLRERDALHDKVKRDVQSSMAALVALQNELLRSVETAMAPFESLEGDVAASLNSSSQSSSSKQVDAAAASAPSRELGDAPEVGAANGADPLDDHDDSDHSSDSNDKQRDVLSQDAATTPDDAAATTSDDVKYDAAASGSDLAVPDENIVRNGQRDHSDNGNDNADVNDNAVDDEPVSRVWVWGRAPTVESGTPLVLRPKTVALLPGQSVLQVACGGGHLLYLTDTGDVYSFGDDEDRRAAAATRDGQRASSFLAPRLVEAFALEKALHRTKVIKVACGAQHSVGVSEAGELYTWGSGEDGRLGHGDMRDRAVPRKVLALLRDRVVHASCGGAHTAVLTAQHRVFTFGRGRNGRLGLGDTKWRDTPHEVTALADGGDTLPAVVHVVCGWNFTAALAHDGRVLAWGKQGEGQCGLGYVAADQLVPQCVERLRGARVVDLACGYTHTLALTADGAVYSWGLGEYGQLGRGVVYQPVPERVDFSAVLGPPDALARVYCGAFHSVAASRARVLFAWGLNAHGACGLGHTANTDAPARVASFASSPDHALVVACGHKYTLALEVPHAAAASVPSHKVPLAATQPAQLAGGGDGDDDGDEPLLFDLPPPLAVSIGSTYALEYGSSGTDTSALSPPRLAYAPSPMDQPREPLRAKEAALRRATKLWRTRVLRDWEQSRDTPLAHALWRDGIPPAVRATVWPLAIGNRLKVTPAMYAIYRSRARAYKRDASDSAAIGIGREHSLALIDTDLPRTFPTLELFGASGPYYDLLLEVLETYACYRPDLGYIQGMSYLAAMLCLHMPTDRYLAFQCLANLLVHEHLFTFYLLDADLSGVYYALFDALLSARQPALHRHLAHIGVLPSMFLLNWLQTLFLQVLPLELATRVFDNFLLDGTVFLFRTAMALLELLQPDLLTAEIDDAMPLLQKSALYHDVWLARVTEDALFRTIAGVAVPSHVYAALDRVVNDVFFYDKRGSGRRGSRSRLLADDSNAAELLAHASGGQSVGIGRVKHERRRMYSISDTLNGVLGGF